MSEFPNQSPDPTTTDTSEAARQVAGTAKEQAQSIAYTSKEQVREAARHVGGQARGEADNQTKRLAHGVRSFADDLSSMSDNAKPGSMAQDVVQQVADGGRQAADWLDHRGLDGLLTEVRSFARRRPGVFLLSATVAGFLVGRLAKATAGSEPEHGSSPSDPGGGEPSTDRDAYSTQSRRPYEAPAAMTAEPGTAAWSHPTGREVT